MKIFKRSISGVSCIDIQAQLPEEVEHMERMAQGQLTITPFMDNGKPCYRVMPDITAIGKPKATDKYRDMPHDDLVTMAVSRGLPIKRDTLTDDVRKILATADTDMDAAIALAENARPAIQSSVPQKRERDYAGSVPMKFLTGNAIL